MSDNSLTSLSDFVGNPKAIEKIQECIQNNAPCVLHGDAGIGKTSLVHLVAEINGYRLIETNASDSRRSDELMDKYQSMRTYGLHKTIYLFDEADGIHSWSLMKKILQLRIHPVVLTANDLYKIPSDIKKLLIEIKFYKPRQLSVLKRLKDVVKEQDVIGDYNNVTHDIRQSINVLKYGSENYNTRSDFDVVDDVFVKHIVSDFEPYMYLWLIDNVENYYSGMKLYQAIQLIVQAMQHNEPTILKFLPKGRGQTKYPYYLLRLKALRGVVNGD